MNFKELGTFSKDLQVLQYKRFYNAKELPKNEKKEIVFIGKSNVGKSSLINTLLNYKINKTSKKPGCTKWIGFLELPNINIIDLPGYGYSSVSKERKSFWDTMLAGYLKENRTSLVLVLVDSRRGISKEDEEVIQVFSKFNTQVIFTKNDKGNNANGIQVSVKNGRGITKLRMIITNK